MPGQRPMLGWLAAPVCHAVQLGLRGARCQGPGPDRPCHVAVVRGQARAVQEIALLHCIAAPGGLPRVHPVCVAVYVAMSHVYISHPPGCAGVMAGVLSCHISTITTCVLTWCVC